MTNLKKTKEKAAIDVSDLFEKRFKLQEQTLSILANSLASLKDSAPNEIKVFFNVALFVNIISYDIKVICRDIIFATSKWHKRHYARQATLVVYESINDLFELLGKDFKSLTSKIPDPEFQTGITDFRAALNQFKKRHFKQLKDIRNNATAHRDKEALKQLTSILGIEEDSILKMTLEFEGILHDLEKLLQKFFQEIEKSL